MDRRCAAFLVVIGLAQAGCGLLPGRPGLTPVPAGDDGLPTITVPRTGIDARPVKRGAEVGPPLAPVATAMTPVARRPGTGGTPVSSASLQRLKEGCLIEGGAAAASLCQSVVAAVARGQDPTVGVPRGGGPQPGDLIIRGPWRDMLAIRPGPRGPLLWAVAGFPSDQVKLGVIPTP